VIIVICGEIMNENDKLDLMFKLREEFMKAMRSRHPRTYPEWPVDPSKKKIQQALRETTLKGVEEMFEALQLLKNWKPHKLKGEKEFDREEFLEEVVDAFNFFLAVLVLLGVDSTEFIAAFEKKNKKIHDRLQGNY
jgi:hypothetical protein